jgi:hypothetical protein
MTTELDDAQVATIVYATPEGPRVSDIAIADHPLDPDDPRQPGNVILHDADFGPEAFAAALEEAARMIRGAS